MIAIDVGFSCHVFTCAVNNADPDPELYSDGRETRAFNVERSEWSHSLKSIVTSLPQRKCYVTKRGNLVTMETSSAPTDSEYRVFFTARRKDPSTIELVVQSAYLSKRDARSRTDVLKPMAFRIIVSRVLQMKQPPADYSSR